MYSFTTEIRMTKGSCFSNNFQLCLKHWKFEMCNFILCLKKKEIFFDTTLYIYIYIYIHTHTRWEFLFMIIVVIYGHWINKVNFAICFYFQNFFFFKKQIFPSKNKLFYSFCRDIFRFEFLSICSLCSSLDYHLNNFQSPPPITLYIYWMTLVYEIFFQLAK